LGERCRGFALKTLERLLAAWDDASAFLTGWEARAAGHAR